jgi:hypothetical protein
MSKLAVTWKLENMPLGGIQNIDTVKVAGF